MAKNIEILDNYEKNGKTYTGSFPMFVSNVICDTGSSEDEFQQSLEFQLSLIKED